MPTSARSSAGIFLCGMSPFAVPFCAGLKITVRLNAPRPAAGLGLGLHLGQMQGWGMSVARCDAGCRTKRSRREIK